MYLLPLPELTLSSEFEEQLVQNIWNTPDAAWTTTPSGLTQWSPVLGVELEMFRNKLVLSSLIHIFKLLSMRENLTLSGE